MHPYKAKRLPCGHLGRIWGAGMLVGLAMTLVVGGPAAQAQPRPTPSSTLAAETAAPSPQLEREVLMLQQKLAAVNVEVKALKQGPRNLSTDYRLRQKLADAESLGRKLTEAEARLRTQRGGLGRDTSRPAAPSPRASATDGPVELAAKADILLDQAQKLVAQADRLEHRVVRERTRSTLRARARHLEQDPFVGLESSKRNIAFSRSSQAGTKTPEPSGGGELSPAADDLASAPPVAGPSNAPVPEGSVVENASGGRNAPEPVALPGDVSAGTVSVGLRALLDAGTLAQLERIEGSADPRARAKALQAVVAALRKQALELQAQAKSLRAQR